MKQFYAKHRINNRGFSFTEDTAPDWLTGVNQVRGSTMDSSWFWRGYVLTLEIDQSVNTDFHRITRTH